MNNDRQNAPALREAELTVERLEKLHQMSSTAMESCTPDDPRIGLIDSNDIIDWYYALDLICELSKLRDTISVEAAAVHQNFHFGYSRAESRELKNSPKFEFHLAA
jgi:hypothetical protein